MKTVYRLDDNKIIPEPATNPQVLNELPVGVYSVGAHPMIGFYLTPMEPFALPEKIYGSVRNYAGRILTTFEDREASTGVLLTGEKGSGKSLLSKMLSAELLKKGISTLVVNAPFCGDSFNAFIQRINAPTMVLFDEYEKVYNSDQQQGLLTLMDGVYPSKKLFVLTCNAKYRVDAHMRNRPGRLYYSIDFAGMTEADVRDYVSQELKNQAHADSVVRFSQIFYNFNFDMLKALVQEMNRYNEPATEAYKLLNAKPDDYGTNDLRYDIVVVRLEDKATVRTSPTIWRGMPFSHDDEINLNGYVKTKDAETGENDTEHVDIEITQSNMIPEMCSAGAQSFRSDCGKFVITFTPHRAPVRYYDF